MSTDTHTTHDAEDDDRNRDIKIYVNGDLVHRDEAKVSVYDSGFMLCRATNKLRIQRQSG